MANQPTRLHLDAVGVAVLVHKIIEAWYIQQLGLMLGEGIDVAFVQECLDRQGIVIAFRGDS